MNFLRDFAIGVNDIQLATDFVDANLGAARSDRELQTAIKMPVDVSSFVKSSQESRVNLEFAMFAKTEFARLLPMRARAKQNIVELVGTTRSAGASFANRSSTSRRSNS